MTCDLPCDEGKVAQEADRALEGLQSVFSDFDPAKVKDIKVRELAEGCAIGVRGFYDFSSGTVTLCCVNGKVCVETLVHELLHSNSFTKRRTAYLEGLTEFLTLYYLKKRKPVCVYHRLTDEACRINKEYEVYAAFWANLAVAIGVDRLWAYYSEGGGPEIDGLTRLGVFDASLAVKERYGIEWSDLLDALVKLP